MKDATHTHNHCLHCENNRYQLPGNQNLSLTFNSHPENLLP